MKFLIDAQLPRRLAYLFQEEGYEAKHTSDLPDGNRTKDADLIRLSRLESMVLVTKDRGFADDLLLGRGVYKLLLVSTGNISNEELLALFRVHLHHIVSLLQEHRFVELSRQLLVVHW